MVAVLGPVLVNQRETATDGHSKASAVARLKFVERVGASRERWVVVAVLGLEFLESALLDDDTFSRASLERLSTERRLGHAAVASHNRNYDRRRGWSAIGSGALVSVVPIRWNNARASNAVVSAHVPIAIVSARVAIGSTSNARVPIATGSGIAGGATVP